LSRLPLGVISLPFLLLLFLVFPLSHLSRSLLSSFSSISLHSLSSLSAAFRSLSSSLSSISRIKSSISLGLFLALDGSGLNEDEEATATSGPHEATRAGGVMEGLIHGSAPLPGCCCGPSILSAHPCQQTFQILQKCTSMIQKQSF
ncbi:hypothetical protein PO909_018267, partial [Leuciscus waleckii]